MEHFLELKELFIGSGLQQPPTSWFCPVDEPFIEINGEIPGIDDNTVYLNLGSLSPLEPSHHWAAVSNLTQQPLMIWVAQSPRHISLQWENHCPETLLPPAGGSARMQLTFNGSAVQEQQLEETITLVAEMEPGIRKEFFIKVNLQVRVNFPYGHFSFDGRPTPGPHDFGKIDPVNDEQPPGPYTLTIHNKGNEALALSLSPPPDWLQIDVGGQQVAPALHTFQVQPGAESTVSVRPVMGQEYLGPRHTRLKLSTNDIRPYYRELELPISVAQEIQGPYVILEKPVKLELLPGKGGDFTIPLVNKGNGLARISAASSSPAITVGEGFVIPEARDNTVQRLQLPAAIDTHGLAPGNHQLQLQLTVSGGNPEPLNVPVHVRVIGITTEPAHIDFGELEPHAETRLTARVTCTDGRPLDIMARPVKELQPVLSCDVAENGTVTVATIPAMGNRTPVPSSFDGPGIEIFELKTNYRIALPVRFTFSPPRAGKLCPQCFMVSEPGVPFCSNCSYGMAAAQWVLTDQTLTCVTCARVFGNELKYCPVDGGQLTLPEEV